MKSKKDSKQMLFEMMGKIDSTFKPVLNEGVWKNMMDGVRTSENGGPYTLVAFENNKLVGQTPNITIQNIIPAEYEAMKKKFPNAHISIEDGGGQIVWRG